MWRYLASAMIWSCGRRSNLSLSIFQYLEYVIERGNYYTINVGDVEVRRNVDIDAYHHVHILCDFVLLVS
jgi:hypothetical protein